MMIFGSLMRFCVDGILMELLEHNASVLRRCKRRSHAEFSWTSYDEQIPSIARCQFVLGKLGPF